MSVSVSSPASVASFVWEGDAAARLSLSGAVTSHLMDGHSRGVSKCALAAGTPGTAGLTMYLSSPATP